MIANSSKELIPVPSGTLKIPASSELPSPTEPVYFSLIIPTYNEGKNILAVVHLLSHLLDEALPNNYEMIVIDCRNQILF